MAKLIIDGLATCLTVKELKLALDDIPSGLRVAYDATMQRIIDQGRSRSRRAFEVLKWVLLAKRPLRSDEMEHLISIEHQSEDIDLDDIVPATTLASLCAGLVVIDDYGEFRFIHQTVPEYLEKNYSEKFRDAEACLSECCLTYIRYQSFAEGPCKDMDTLKARSSHYPAYSYCASYWYKHMVASGTLFQEQKQAALEFFQSEPHWRSANQETIAPFEVGSGIPSVDNNTRLHYAAFLDAHLLFEDLMNLDPTCLNRKGLAGESPLMVAARDGMLQFLRRLLEAGAEVNVLDNQGYSALHWAVWQNDPKPIDVLVAVPQVDINIRIKGSNDVFSGESPLMIAARVGNVETVTTLITAGADVNMLNDRGDTALHVAMQPDRVAVIGALLDNGMDVDLLGEDEDPDRRLSAVMLASLHGYVDILDIVLKHNPNVNLRSHDGGKTALLFGVQSENIDAVKLLLAQKTIEVDPPESGGWTPLIYAASLGMTEIVSDLLAHGANLNRQNIWGTTAILMASWKNHTDTVKTLLSFPGVDVNSTSPEDGCTALHDAVRWGNAELVELLISHGAYLQIRDKFNGLTPLDYARYFNDRQILDLLTASGPGN
jgi:ankyrin repeat protein